MLKIKAEDGNRECSEGASSFKSVAMRVKYIFPLCLLAKGKVFPVLLQHSDTKNVGIFPQQLILQLSVDTSWLSYNLIHSDTNCPNKQLQTQILQISPTRLLPTSEANGTAT